MQGLVKFAHEVGGAILAWVPVFCYGAGGGFLILACWMFYDQQRPTSPWKYRPLIPAAVMCVGFFLLGFAGFVNLLTGSFGGSRRIAFGEAMTAYDMDVEGMSFLGGGPMETFLAIVSAFLMFFVAVGLAFILHGLFGLKGAATRERAYRYFPPAVEIVAGSVIMNLEWWAKALAESFGYGAG